METDAVRAVHSAAAELGEGPVWVAEQSALYWLDIFGKRILAYRPVDGTRREWPTPLRLTALAPCTGGGFIAGSERGLVRLGGPSGPVLPLAELEPDLPGNRCNDGKVDARGRFWIGTMDDAEQERSGALYRFDPDRSWRCLAEGYGVANGPAFSPDGQWAYHTDSAARLVYRFPLSATGEPGRRETFLGFGSAHGYPDGMTTDAEGHLWIAFWDGWCLRRFSPEGELVQTLDLPVQRPTSCAFGGEGLDQLFVTSARIGLSAADLAAQPEAGSLFACRVAVPGLPSPLFAG